MSPDSSSYLSTDDALPSDVNNGQPYGTAVTDGGGSYSDSKRRWYRLKKWFSRHQPSSEDISGLVALLSMALIVLILSGRYMFQETVVSQGQLTRDVYADRELSVDNIEETQLRRAELLRSVEPVYHPEPGADKLVMDRVVTLLEDIADSRQQHVSESAKRHLIKSSLDTDPSPKQSRVISTLIATNHWASIYNTAAAVTETLVQKGITSEAVRHHREQLVRSALDDFTEHSTYGPLTAAEQDAVVFLVGLKLRPTVIIDEALTQQARDRASERVESVKERFHKGDLIGHHGDRATPLQLEALKEQGTLTQKNQWLSIAGVSILALSLMGIVWGYLYRFEHSHFFKPNFAALLGVSMILSVGGLSLFMDFKAPSMAVEDFPIPILSLLLCIFIHPRIAILTTMMVLLLCGLALRIPLESLSVLVIASLVGIFVFARKPVPKDRSDVILSGCSIGVAQALSILAVGLIYASYPGNQFNFLWHATFGMLSGIVTGILTLGILPLIESIFKLITPYTLLELGNHDRPILKRLQLEAPGTFHHSVMVASLAEAASEAIGANPILARVGSLYHDIGKIKRPLFFIENQSYFGVENPHDKLTPRLSKMVITAHPRDGVEIAKQLNLPDVLMRFMMEHHGTLITGYFFNKAVIEEGTERVNKNHFRYAGPKPQSKETAIVMLADACESAVRALKNPNLAQIEERVETLFHQRIDDDQFSECPITFQEIQIVKDTFVRVLRAIQHERIEYQQNVLQELGRKEPTNPLDAMLAKAGVSNAMAEPMKTIPPELNSALAAIGAQEASPSQHHLSQSTLSDLIAEANEHGHDDDDDEPAPECEGCFPTNAIMSANGVEDKDAKAIPFDLPIVHTPEEVPDFAVENPEL